LKPPLPPNEWMITDDNTSYSLSLYCTVNPHLSAHGQDQDTSFPYGSSELAHQHPLEEDWLSSIQVTVICIDVLLFCTIRLWVRSLTKVCIIVL
jgi:hypothetical protein